jgi:hypothetical protein
MYTISLSIEPSLKLNIHNQCLNIDLVSPTYFTNDGTGCRRPPSLKVCAGSVMRPGLIVSYWSTGSTSALIYKLQRRRPHKSTEISKGTSSTVHILILWRLLFEPKELYVDVLLVEYDKGFDRYKLEKLCYEDISRSRMYLDSATEIWLLDDNTALMTTFEVVNSQLLNVTISEVEKDDCMRTLIHIDPER